MTGRTPLSDAVLRGALQKRVDESSLRAMEAETGISFSNIRSFLRGASPQRATREKLVRWYYSRGKGVPTIPPDDVANAVALLRVYFRDESKPLAVRERRRREVMDRLGGDAD